jgi:hypothetical protein
MLRRVHHPHLLGSQRDRREGREEDDSLRTRQGSAGGVGLWRLRPRHPRGRARLQKAAAGVLRAFIATRLPANVQQNREKKQTKIEQSGMTEAELIAAQEELFKTATNKFNAPPPA